MVKNKIMDKETRIKMYEAAIESLERQDEGGNYFSGICSLLHSCGGDKTEEYPEFGLFVPPFLWSSEWKCGSYWFGWPGQTENQLARIMCLSLCIEIAKTSKR